MTSTLFYIKFLKYYMINQRRIFFISLKTSYKIIIFICMICFCLLGVYSFTYIYLKNEIKNLVSNQQTFLKEQNLTFQFKSISSSWRLWPQIILAYPSLQKNTRTTSSQTLWQARQATFSYSLWHPFNLSITLNGEQLFCLNNNSTNCFQIHGDPWTIYVPLMGKQEQQTITLQSKELFYTNTPQTTWGIRSLQLKNIQFNVNWNPKTNRQDSFGFSEIYIEQALINIGQFSTQKLNNIQIQAAIIKDKNTTNPSNLYKLLIQKADLSWDMLAIHSSGKIYFPYPQSLPTGEIFLHLTGINQAIYQQLASLNCCAKLKENLSQITLPSQLNFTLLIREGVFYLGAVPLQTIWYDHLKNFMNTYTK